MSYDDDQQDIIDMAREISRLEAENDTLRQRVEELKKVLMETVKEDAEVIQKLMTIGQQYIAAHAGMRVRFRDADLAADYEAIGQQFELLCESAADEGAK